MNITEIMTKSVEHLEPQTTLESAARTMRDSDLGGLPVLKDGQMIGFLTDRDIVTRAIAEGHAPGTSTAQDVMTEDVFCINSDQGIEDASELMRRHQIRRLVVIDKKKHPIGMITLSDLAQHSPKADAPASVLQAVSKETSADRPYCC